MGMSSNKPYLIRAIYDWIVDNNLTPYILVDAEYPGVQVPEAHVNGGKIILNISPQACRGLHLENDRIIFTARFSGQTVQIVVVPAAVIAIYARENGRGMEFGVEYDEAKSPDLTSESSKMKAKSKPSLTLVKKD
ncbi:ClpXP protease specificity-enhancing factor [Legionella spiritensis]|uniref:ClpXP protease specificity-enhancing factor n=1 Tax=Legionella spiritensis TaxID=452 RepID=UPI000F6B6C41|nr:ClpXP protease specificity-enhancing factor [Legionella spiritensis]VEG91058.1 stringent starvation protein B [Legionella spiritensis]